MESAGYCQKGDACTFAHSPAELANGDENANGSSNLEQDQKSLLCVCPGAKIGTIEV